MKNLNGIIIVTLTIWLLPARAQTSSHKSEIVYYSSIFSSLIGKTKSVSSIEYHTGDFYPEIKGKIKSIGSTASEYYTGDFYPEIKGKIKSIGSTDIAYYTGDFYPEIKGKVKSIGKTEIVYHTGDFYPEIKGKVKSINGSLSENFLLLFPELRIIN